MAEMLAPVVKYLIAGGLMVITMKFPARRKRKGQHPAADDDVELLLRESFKNLGYDIVVRLLCLVFPLVFPLDSSFVLPLVLSFVSSVSPDAWLTPNAERTPLATAGREVGAAALKHVVRKDGPVPPAWRCRLLSRLLF